ncbi:MAG TPA: protein kinase [Methylomirabilota bacterium]
MPPMIGTRVGRYELLEKVGSGGMGEVYRARDHDLHRDVGIKFLPERFASDSDRLSRFAHEARAASSLNHPNIVTIHEIGQSSGVPYIVMEFVEGETLRALLSGRPLPTRRLLEIAGQLADGLAKAHAAGIVHRDLKPENIMVTRDRFVKILDFGLAKLLTESPSGRDEGGLDSSLVTLAPPSPNTSAGVVLGTAGYMSPEQTRGRPVDYRSDQFALGVILYEMTTGRHPFRRETHVQTLAAIIDDQPEPIGSLNPAMPVPVCWIVERCLAKEPGERYTSTSDLARELHNILEHLSDVGSTAPMPAAGAAAHRPGRTRDFRVAGAGLVLFAVLAGVSALVPAIRDKVALTLHLRTVPADKHLAILPFRAAGATEEDRALADGLIELLTVHLTRLERFQKTLSVEPVSNVRQAGVSSAETASRALGVTMVVAGSVQRVEGRLVFTAILEDAVRKRTLRAETADSPETLVAAVVHMLDLELNSDEKAALRASGTGVAEAAVLSAQALGYNLYAEGRNALERYDQVKSLERAVELFNRALERDPGYALAHAGLGEAHWRLYRATRRPEYVTLARQHCERALSLDGLLAPAWVTLGIIEAGTGHAEEAIVDFKRALDREPRSAPAYRELGRAYERLNRLAEAEATYKKAIALRPDSWSGYSYLGYVLVTQGRSVEAERVYAQALELAPDNAELWDSLGSARYYQERFADAQAAYTKSLALYPRPQTMSNLATLQFYLGRYADAAKTLEQATRTGARDFRIWRNLGAALYWAPGERNRAPAAYRKAAELAEEERKIDPRNPLTLVQLADCYAMLGEPARALAVAAEGLGIGPVDASLAAIAAGIYEVLGDRTEALRWIGVALKAGQPRLDIERDPTFKTLITDRRYVAMTEGKKPVSDGKATS